MSDLVYFVNCKYCTGCGGVGKTSQYLSKRMKQQQYNIKNELNFFGLICQHILNFFMSLSSRVVCF